MEVSPSRYDLELADVNYIVERYQQRAFEVEPVVGVFSSYMNILESSRQIIDLGMSSLAFSDIKSAEQIPSNEPPADLIGDVQCSEDKDFEYQMMSNTSGNSDYNMPKDMADDNAQKYAEIPANDDEKCVDCGERPNEKYEFNYKPIFALDGLRDLLNSVNTSLDNLMRQLDPYSFVNGLCPFLDTFKNRMCVFDLKALIGMISMLIGRYSMSAMELTLNWSLLLGPMVKGIAEITSNLIEEVMNQISYWFNCMKAWLNFAKQVIVDAQRLITETGNLIDRTVGDSLEQISKAENWAASGISKANTVPNNTKANVEFDFTNSELMKENFSFRDFSGKNIANGKSSYPGSTGEIHFNTSKFGTQEHRFGGRSKGDGLATSLNVRYRPTMESMFGLGKPLSGMNGFGKTVQGTSNVVGALNTELVDRILAVVNSCEDYIKGLFGNLLISIKSLNSMMSQNFNTTVKLGGMILALSDLIQLCISLASKDKFNFTTEGICDQLKAGDFEPFDALLKSWYGVDEIFDIEGLENGQVRIDSGIYNIDAISCGLPIVTDDQREMQKVRFSTEGDLNWIADLFKA